MQNNCKIALKFYFINNQAQIKHFNSNPNPKTLQKKQSTVELNIITKATLIHEGGFMQNIWAKDMNDSLTDVKIVLIRF